MSSKQKENMEILLNVIRKRIKLNYNIFCKLIEELFGSFIVSESMYELDNMGKIVYININNMLKEIELTGDIYYLLKRYDYIVVEREKQGGFNVLCKGDGVIKKNTDALKYISKKKWENLYITQIYNNLEVKVFKHDNEYYAVTKYGKLNINLLEVLDELTEKLFKEKITNIVKEGNIYTFYIISDRVKKYINNGIKFLGNVDELIQIKEIVDIKSGENIVVTKGDIIPNVNRMYFSCLDEMKAKLDILSLGSKINKKINLIGYQIRVNNNDEINGNGNGDYDIVEIYTDTYWSMMENIGNFKNVHQLYLELYQQNKLNNFLPFVSKYTTEIKQRINMSVKTIAKEILNIYHATRKQKNKNLYDILPDSYKKILFNLHGIYIDDRKKDFIELEKEEYNESRSISIHDVYYYVKYLTPSQLKQLFKDRPVLVERDKENKYMCKDCIYTKTMSKLMFDNTE